MFALWVGAFSVLLGFVVFAVQGSGDYQVGGIVGGDNAGPGLQAMLHGSLAGYVKHQPIVGLTSILLRLPVMAVGSAFGAGALLNYQLGALVCLLPLAFLGAWLLTRTEFSGRQQVLTLICILIVIASPIVSNGISDGHPEGTLSKVLAVGAVLAATRGRAGWAAIMLGLAVSAKESALIAVPPVLIALPRNRREVLLIAGGLVFLLTCAVWLSDPNALLRAVHGEGGTTFLSPFGLLWAFATPVRVGNHFAANRVMPWGLDRVTGSAVTLAVAMPFMAGWYLWARRRGAKCDPLALLALLGIMRCVCDTTHEAYYAMSMLIPVATWECMRNRPPVITALISFGNPIFYGSLGHLSSAYLYVTSTAMAVLLIVYVARHALVAPPAVRPVRARVPSARVGAIVGADLCRERARLSARQFGKPARVAVLEAHDLLP
jgi:hypothetical protein